MLFNADEPQVKEDEDSMNDATERKKKKARKAKAGTSTEPKENKKKKKEPQPSSHTTREAKEEFIIYNCF